MLYKSIIKPALDRFFALILLVLFSPIWLLLLSLIWIIQGSPVFFIQPRSGLEIKHFSIYKIRTLEPSTTESLSISHRSYTPLGKCLRRTGLDELPQIINILKGEMSFIGPRAMPIEYEDKYTDIQKKRFHCKPGLTGLAQVNGRNNISWEERFELDNVYVEKISFLWDIKILAKTITHFFNFEKQAEMPVFTGSNIS